MKHQAAVIFKNNSRTYYYSSIFFPPKVKQEVFTVYAFVRTADDFVDQIKPLKAKYLAFKETYHLALAGKEVDDEIITNFARLVKSKQIEPRWVEDFFTSMEMDLSGTEYKEMKTTLKYIFGSAEVVGLMMAAIMELPSVAHMSARLLGRAMQYINFIRDIEEDQRLNRCYFPQVDLARYGIKSLSRKVIQDQPESFCLFIRDQISLYQKWQAEAERGYRYIPRRYLIPIKTAADMYKWTAKMIYKDPLVILTKKVKPSRNRVIFRALQNALWIKRNR